MNETQLKEIRSHMKNTDTSLIRVREMVAVYVKKDTEEILHSKECHFEPIENDDKDFLMKNFKKIISGKLNKNLFELRFADNSSEGSTEGVLHNMLNAASLDDFATEANIVVNKILDNYTYDTDIVIHLIRFSYSTENENIPFILGTVNKVEAPKGVFVYDDLGERDFTTEYGTNRVINLASPIDGFMFPVFEDGQTNVSKLLNYHKKANETNTSFIQNVLNCKVILTEQQEKSYFNSILRSALGQRVKPKVLANIYSIIHRTYETEEDLDQRLLTRGELERILESQEVEVRGNLQHVYEEVLGLQNYSFKVDNIVPDFSKKSIRIETSEADIVLNPRHLDRVHQVKDENGEMYLMVKLSGDSYADGISLESDEIDPINFN